MSEDEQRIQYSGGINESSALKQSNGMNGHCIRTKSLFVNESILESQSFLYRDLFKINHSCGEKGKESGKFMTPHSPCFRLQCRFLSLPALNYQTSLTDVYSENNSGRF